MTDAVWVPSLDDTELDSLSARLRAAVRDVLPELVNLDGKGGSEHRPRAVEIELSPGLRLTVEATHMRHVTRADRPVLETRLQGTVRSVDPETGRPIEMPVSGDCRLDLATGAVVHISI